MKTGLRRLRKTTTRHWCPYGGKQVIYKRISNQKGYYCPLCGRHWKSKQAFEKAGGK